MARIQSANVRLEKQTNKNEQGAGESSLLSKVGLMKCKALRDFTNREGGEFVKRGQVLDITEARFEELSQAGCVEPVNETKEKEQSSLWHLITP